MHHQYILENLTLTLSWLGIFIHVYVFMYVSCCMYTKFSLCILLLTIYLCLGVAHFNFSLLGICGFMNLDVHFSSHIWKNFLPWFLNRHSIPFYPSSSGILITYIYIVSFDVSYAPKAFFTISFFLCFCFNWLSSNDLSLSSLISFLLC